MAAARLACLSRADSLENYDGHIAFLELTFILNEADIRQVCTIKVFPRHKPYIQSRSNWDNESYPR
jgi:hypothetical protein